jgi:hypothetical protein
MKREITFKTILLTASFLSLLAFAFVNIQTNSVSALPFSKSEIVQNQVQSEAESQNNEIPVPNVTVLGRVWEIAQRLLDRSR